jgi:hypothetical protein
MWSRSPSKWSSSCVSVSCFSRVTKRIILLSLAGVTTPRPIATMLHRQLGRVPAAAPPRWVWFGRALTLRLRHAKKSERAITTTSIDHLVAIATNRLVPCQREIDKFLGLLSNAGGRGPL